MTPDPADLALVVDDEPAIAHLVSRILQGAGYPVVTATSAAEARRLLGQRAVTIVVSDLRMPEESGIELLRGVLATNPTMATIVVSGMDDSALEDEALDLGVFGFVPKPFRPNQLLYAVGSALRRRRLEVESLGARESLEQTVLERTASLRRALEDLARSESDLRRSNFETIRRLAMALSVRDEGTGTHVERMSGICGLMARWHGLSDDRVQEIQLAASLHDIGKLGIPDSIMLKPGPLDADERKLMETHTVLGHRMLSGSGLAFLELAATIAWTHHERFDGTGYPNRVAGQAIPVEGRIAMIADVFDALVSDRPYRAAMSLDDAVALMRAERGTMFDPELFDIFDAHVLDIVGSMPEQKAA